MASRSVRTLGNVCLGVAAVLYALPLQYLLFGLSPNTNGGGVLAGLLVIGPMWLLLIAASMCVIAGGGLNGLRLNRGMLYALTVLATIAMAIVSFLLRFEMGTLSGVGHRVLGTLSIHVFPVLTMVLVLLSLNPRLPMRRALPLVMAAWTTLGALHLTVGGGFVGYTLLVRAGRQVAGVGSQMRSASQRNEKDLASIPSLDPRRDFGELVRLTSESHSRAVREAALAQLQRHPDFVDSLVAELASSTASSGRADHALELVEFAVFSPDERERLALPARSAMTRITKYIRSEFQYATNERRRGTRERGRRIFKSIAAKFSATGVDFRSAVAAFEQTFDTHE